ncbi:hypothetical protein, partial [Atlantibacter hermannii]|uniref:hypothetical protein n=1 Tax=Atlantibacter hermannii TaxID=565 RepID=UPI0028A0CC51
MACALIEQYWDWGSPEYDTLQSRAVVMRKSFLPCTTMFRKTVKAPNVISFLASASPHNITLMSS